MQKHIAILFILSFLLLALAICIVPATMQSSNDRQVLQMILIALAISLDIVAMRYKNKPKAL